MSVNRGLKRIKKLVLCSKNTIIIPGKSFDIILTKILSKEFCKINSFATSIQSQSIANCNNCDRCAF